MLSAIDEPSRLRLIAHPFDCPTPSGTQYYSRLVYIPAPAAGTVKWASSSLPPCEDLKRRYPDLAKHISLGTDYNVPGDKIELYTDGARTYVAHLLVYSRVSREEAIAIGNEVQRCYEIGIEEDEGGMRSFSASPVISSRSRSRSSSIFIPFVSIVLVVFLGWSFF